tara:strand:+ start:486 stop:1067 length:582 start_codon:yes stop_codon:yes gene_type:complete
MVAKEVCLVRVIMAVMGPVVEHLIVKEPGMVAVVVVLVQMELMHLFQLILGNNISGHNIAVGLVGLLMLVMVVRPDRFHLLMHQRYPLLTFQQHHVQKHHMDMVPAVVVDLEIVVATLVISLHLLVLVATVVADMVAEHIHAQDMEYLLDLVQKLETPTMHRLDMLQWVAVAGAHPLIRLVPDKLVHLVDLES